MVVVAPLFLIISVDAPFKIARRVDRLWQVENRMG